ncbi:MAG: hypothetical protein ACREAW_00070 [Nitrososphaera sp.]
MAEIVISCAGDSALARDIYDYARSRVNGTEYISLDEDEIGIDRKSQLPRETVKKILESFVKSNPKRLKDYQIVESGDTFVVAIVVEPSKMVGLITCEMCGYFTPYPEEMLVHKRMHAGWA